MYYRGSIYSLNEADALELLESLNLQQKMSYELRMGNTLLCCFTVFLTIFLCCVLLEINFSIKEIFLEPNTWLFEYCHNHLYAKG